MFKYVSKEELRHLKHGQISRLSNFGQGSKYFCARFNVIISIELLIFQFS
jgi:hypothetical protein